MSTVMAEAATTKHTIKNGETLYTIAHKNHTTIEEVRKVNGLKKGDTLKLGRVLTVPMNTYFPNKKKKAKKIAQVSKKSKTKKKVKLTKKTRKASKYVIKSGDTLFTIARKHGMTVAKLLTINQIEYKSTLKLGQTLSVVKMASTSKKQKRMIAKKKKIAKAKKVHKIKIVKTVKKNKKANRTLKTALKKHAKPLASKRVKRRKTVTVDDIFFRASKPNIMFFGGKSSKKAKNIEEIAFESLQGIILATTWYLVIFGIAYFLESILPPFKWTLLIASAYAVKYLLLLLDIWLFLNALYSELIIGTKRISNYRKEKT